MHSVTGPSSFRVEYRRAGGPTGLNVLNRQRTVKFQIDILRAHPTERAAYEVYCVQFKLISGDLVILFLVDFVSLCNYMYIALFIQLFKY